MIYVFPVILRLSADDRRIFPASGRDISPQTNLSRVNFIQICYRTTVYYTSATQRTFERVTPPPPPSQNYDDKLHADDTSVQVTLTGNKKTRAGRLWIGSKKVPDTSYLCANK